MSSRKNRKKFKNRSNSSKSPKPSQNQLQLELKLGSVLGYVISRTDTGEMLASFIQFQSGHLAAWCNFPTEAKRFESPEICKVEASKLEFVLGLPLAACKLIDSPARYYVEHL